MSHARNFGAQGDGETDDTDALQHALEAGDGVLRLKKGTYRITRPIVLDTTKQGFGAVLGEGGTARIVMAGAGPALRVIGDHQGTASPKSVQDHTWDKERLPQISDIEIAGAHPMAVGIELFRTMKCTITGVLVRQCQHGIRLIGRNRDFVLANSHLYDNREIGLFFDECDLHQIIVHGNHISWNKVAGIKSQNGDVHNLQIVGNDIEYNNVTSALAGKPAADHPDLAEHHGGAEIWFEATGGTISEVTISGNTIQATVQQGGTNIRVVGADAVRARSAAEDKNAKADTAHLINITGNVLGSQWRAVDLRHASRVTITGNTIYDSADLSIRAVHCSGLAISGNTFGWRGIDSISSRDGLLFEDCENVLLSGLVTQRLCAGSAEKGAGIALVRCRDCGVSDCQVLDPLHRGLELLDCVRCRVANNTIVDRRPQPKMRHAVRVSGNSRDNLIVNNMLGGATVKPLAMSDEQGQQRGNLELPTTEG
ncbi:MAG: right-handed parallel beta-helix repeat-containing protein [Pirellulales bacterium]